MNFGILVVLLAPFFYMVANMVDKLQLHGDKEDSEPGALMALGSVVGILFIIPLGTFIYFTDRSLGGWDTIIALIFNEIPYNIAIWIYMAVMKREEVSKVIPWFQSIPAFGLIGAFLIIGEKLSLFSILAIGLLMVGGFILSFHKGKVKFKFIGLMILCSILLAIYDVVFAEFGRDIDAFSAVFIAIVGKTLWSLPILIGKKERNGFIVAIKTRLLFQSTGEVTNLVADTVMHFCLLAFPVAIVQGICCTQPFFVFVAALILTKKFPDVFKEDVSGISLVQKIIGITFMVIGGIVLSV